MRQTKKSGLLSVQAVAGTYVVLLGINLPQEACSGLLGFAIRRQDHTEGETYWLKGNKTFESVEPNPAPGALYSTRKYPIQGFSWSDFSAKPGYEYTYEIVAMRGTPASPQESEKVKVKVKTESTEIQGSVHHVYFNRGAAASQEYTRRFGNKSPVEVGSEAFKWLSRGAAEAIKTFIERAEGPGWGLRVGAYEFTEDQVLGALKEAWQTRQADVKILYHALKDQQKIDNEAKIATFGLGDICHPRNGKGLSLSHNKVIILLKDGEPQAMLTGSTNFSEGGIYGHSNVVHICEDKEIAKRYLWLWNKLVDNKEKKSDAAIIADQTPLPQDSTQPGITPLFSPRSDLEALQWYATQAKDASDALFMTFAFGMHELFQDAYRDGKAQLRYALMEKMTGPTRTVEDRKIKEAAINALRAMPQNNFAIGTPLRQGGFNQWLNEQQSGLNKNVQYIHTKYMLINPLSDHPLVVSGSANFSNASTLNNDENMLIIWGDTRVADVYLGEFMRMYNHFAFREWLAQHGDSPNAEISHLDEKDQWWKKYFGDTFEARQRAYFSGAV